MKAIAYLALSLIIGCQPSGERPGNETGMAETEAPAADPVATDTLAARDTVAATPAGILSQLNVANTTEIQLSKLAAKQASSPEVKQVAKRLVNDHTRNRERARALAQKLDVNLVPAEGGSIAAVDSAAVPAELQGKTGADFDRAFIQHEIEGHQQNIEKIRTELLPAAQNEAVREYLQSTLTEMEQHLAALREVQQELGA